MGISAETSGNGPKSRRIGHYDLIEPIGAGGMGEVFRARDSRLGRDVAIKVIPDAFLQDAGRMSRFEREAQLLASLNHPNIASIYGVEERAIVMELVEGRELAGPLSVEDAVPLIHQLIDALEYAHEKGVVHRDLKPANIKVTPEGRLKVLDFGLAKALTSDLPAGDPASSPTLTIGGSVAGMIMGTAAYMSPEQARGQNVDKRTDIWAFGVVLFELLTGRRLFEGATISDTLAAVLKEEPGWNLLPARLRRLLRLCLVRDARKRLRDIGDARLLLDDEVPAAPPSLPPARLPWAIAALASALAGVAVWGWLGSHGEPAPMVMRFANPVGVAASPSTRTGNTIALSPDGSSLAFAGGPRSEIYVRALGQFDSRPLPGTEGASFLSFSPDGRWVSYMTSVRTSSGGHLYKIALAGGKPEELADVVSLRSPPGQTWGEDETIVYVSDGVLYRVPAAGGKPEILAKPDAAKGIGDLSVPQWLPGGRNLLVTSGGKTVVFNPRTAEFRPLLDHGYASYAPGAPGSTRGYLVYYAPATSSLMAVPFDHQALKVLGAPIRVLDGVHGIAGPFGAFGVSQSGTLAYVPGAPGSGLRTLVWLDRQGAAEAVPGPPQPYRNPRLSPGGERVALDIGESLDETQRADIWVYDLVRGSFKRITFSDRNSSPLWTPDGNRLIYQSGAEWDSSALISAPADGTSPPPAHPISGTGRRFPESISPDGKLVIGRSLARITGNDFWVLPLEEGATPAAFRPFLDARFRKNGAQFSPDGHWVAYASAETGVNQIYVTAYPGPGGTHAISTDGGTVARWDGTGRELFYLNGGKMMVVGVQTSPQFRAGIPRMLFERSDLLLNTFDVTRDGKRFLMLKSAEPPSGAQTIQLNIVVNWFEELRRLVPVTGK